MLGIIFLLLASSVSAGDLYIINHDGNNAGNGPTTFTNNAGMNFIPNETIKLKSVQLISGATPTILHITNYTNCQELGNAVFVDGVAQVDFTMYAGQPYFLGANSNGSQYNRKYSTAGTAPLTTSHGVWKNATYNACLFDTTLYHNILNFTIETIDPPVASTPYVELALFDLYDNSTLPDGTNCSVGSVFNTSVSGVCYFYNQTTGLNYSVSGSGYFSTAGTAVENDTTQAYLYQGFTNTTGFTNIAGDSVTITLFNATVAGGRTYTGVSNNSSLYLTDGSNSLTAQTPGYNGAVATANITAPENTTTTFTGLYNHTLTLQAFSAENFTMLSTFNVTVYASWQNFSGSTTNGTITFNLLSGQEYIVEYISDTFLNANYTYTPVNSTQYNNQTLYRRLNYFNVVFRNETNRAILNNTLISFNAINALNQYTAYNTTNGTLSFKAGFVPGTYTIRYAAEGWSNRDYYIDLDYNVTYNLSLYLISSDIYGPGVVEVRDNTGLQTETAIIELYRYYGLNGTTTEIVGMATTNNVGEAVMVAEPINAFYFFRVLKDGEVRYNTLAEAPELLALQSDGLWHKQFIMNNTGSGYADETGVSYNWTVINDTLNNGSIYNFGVNVANSVAALDSCTLYLLKAGDMSVLNTSTGFCSATGGSSSFLYRVTTDENLIVKLEYVINSNTYTAQRYYSVKAYEAGELTLKHALDSISAFDKAGFDSGFRFLLALIAITVLTIGVTASTQLLSKPSEILLFVFSLTLLFSFAGWLYVPLETIPITEVKQYLIAILIGLITIFVFYDEQRVST